MRRLCLLVAALAFACHSGLPGEVPSDGGLPDGGHALPGPGFAAAWQVRDARELVTGPSTGGRAGDYELANSRVRFIVEDARASDGYDPYGCSIAAADRQRAAGVPGQSRWGEVWLGLNFRAAGCDTISVVNDGSDGQPAVVRAAGHDAESPFMASLFAPGSIPPSLHATIYREYSLAPDTDAMLFNLTIQNDGDATLNLTAPYVGMAMNRGLRHWVDKSGFDFGTTYDERVSLNTSASYYAAVGDKVSYSLLELHAPFSPIINFAHVLIGQYPQVSIAPGHAETFHYAVAVGTGDTGSLQVAHNEVLGDQSGLVPLSGTVVDASGLPVSAARVHLTDASGVVAFARTGSDGTWTAPVRAASYTIRALADDRIGSTPQTIAVPLSGLTGVTLTLGAQSTISVQAVDKDNNPIPAKIVLEPVSTPRPALPVSLGEMWDRQPIIVFSPDGTAVVPVYPGTWKVTVSHGFEYDLPSVTVTAGGPPVKATLHRVVDTTGWVSGDFHVHAQYSPDGDDLLSLKVRAFAADGVEVPVSTEHEFIGDFGPTAAALSLTPFMHTIPGTELTTTAQGHFNVFPLVPQAGLVNAGAFSWFNRTIPQVIADARLRLTPDGTPPVIQMNHPRASGMAYLDWVHFDPNSYTGDQPDFMKNWDAMEVWNGTPITTFEGCNGAAGCVAHPTAFDWFSFLDRNNHVTGTGNSDSHRAETNTVGYPRTYLQTGVDDPAQITDAMVTKALHGMNATISGGPFLTISAPVSGAPGTASVSSGGLVQKDANGNVVHLTVKVQAPAWMGALDHLDLWVGDSSTQGAHKLAPISLTGLTPVDGLRYSGVVDVPVTVDTWVIATVRGVTDSQGVSHALWPVVQPPYPPYAITNPIWIDADGDGQITPLK